MEFKDYYKILGVDRGSDQKAISAAYRKLARQYHPDINKTKGAEERFKEINEAYQVLGDPQKRARYDQMYEVYQRGGMDWQTMFGGAAPWGRPPGGWTVTYDIPEDLRDLLGGLGGFSDFFQQFFGGGPVGAARRGRRVSATQPAGAPEPAATIEVTLEEAFRGAQKSVTVRMDGTTRRLDVSIPRGVRSGQRIRLPGALDGEDLYLTVQVRPDPRFERQGDALITEVPVALTEALLGATIEVPTLEGPVEMTVPPETQPGQIFRLRGLGMPRREGGRGDQLVRVKVVLPKNLTRRERELVEELGRLRKERVRT
ncbi:MAG: DnaJ C-terminal domain-containing protein [Armatimonadota bacterium]|nr:DnaJ C-terminal domain-containing protein [Armatimonadota bacterium]MDR7450946.1 DnaJ C-terminal domain-containing protein [Armatimonadota bacterium]MDR7465868.1 DnaJ C-terminal domain-containing protein [Armatimonadota bacterium]MDR7493776.1 DnaJ C-terminal domain-containing protein [Armatimonadota bacterium]MDR7498382.1 DnaJ C-terminal domain-containing protein [Armatimonadota bacterium]